MKPKRSYTILLFFFAIVSSISCKNKEEILPQLSVSTASVTFLAEGGISNITLTSNAQWNISNPASSWLQLSQTTGNSSSATIQLTTVLNSSGATRSAVLVVSSPNGHARRITVSQDSQMYPSYNTSPKTSDVT